jgi:hypothetical protein
MLVACSNRDAPPVANQPTPAAEATCKSLPFALSTPVPEASGAAWFTIDDKLELVVVSDSGNDGAYAIVDPDSGETLEQGKLPLDHGSDDIEGLASHGDRLYGLTSAGWIRVWQRDGKGWKLVDGPYPIGDVTLPLHGKPKSDGMVCPVEGGNCGRDYEGLCLAPQGSSCAGFVAAKADGHLYCLVEKDGRFTADHDRAIAVDRPKVVADCAFGDDGTLWVGDNVLGGERIYRVENWQDLAHAKVVEVGDFGVLNSEVLAVHPRIPGEAPDEDIIYRMSDTNAAPSLMGKFRCKRSTR